MASAIETKLRDLGIGVGWTHPFFLPPLARITITEDTQNTPTMSVSIDGKVRVNPAFAATLTDLELAGVLFHELMHLMMDHAGRMEDRKTLVQIVSPDGQKLTVPLWNIAADMAINQVLKEMGLHLPRGACYPPRGDEGLNAEQLYEKLKEDAEKNGKAPQASGGAASGCGTEQGGSEAGDGEGEEGEGQGGGTNWTDEWQKVAAQAKALAVGTQAGDALARLFERRRTMSWRQVVRATVSRALAQHGRDDQTWTRRSRRSPPGIMLPGWKATKAQVAVVIDSSGSVSDDMLTQACDECVAIGAAADVRVYLVVHDHAVQWRGWVRADNRTNIGKRLRGRGGTSFDEAYHAVEAAGKSFDCMIHLTDGEIGPYWPARPRNAKRLVAAMLRQSAYRSTPPSGSVIVEVKV